MGARWRCTLTAVMIALSQAMSLAALVLDQGQTLYVSAAAGSEYHGVAGAAGLTAAKRRSSFETGQSVVLQALDAVITPLDSVRRFAFVGRSIGSNRSRSGYCHQCPDPTSFSVGIRWYRRLLCRLHDEEGEQNVGPGVRLELHSPASAGFLWDRYHSVGTDRHLVVPLHGASRTPGILGKIPDHRVCQFASGFRSHTGTPHWSEGGLARQERDAAKPRRGVEGFIRSSARSNRR
ncbi:hypothetical protein NKDENANG_00600 [Candidatus Entotheonellaceae bacterium PAL068K]